MHAMDSKPDRVKNVAVLLAGGVGARIGLDFPKQLIKVAGKTILEHALIALHSHPAVDEIKIMMAAGHLDAVRAIVKNGGYDDKVTEILEGGETRNDTTLRALDSLGDEECHVLFHDAVRPLVTSRIIQECFDALADLPRGRRRDPVGRHDHRGARRQHDPRHPAARRAAPWPDAPGVPVRR